MKFVSLFSTTVSILNIFHANKYKDIILPDSSLFRLFGLTVRSAAIVGLPFCRESRSKRFSSAYCS